MQRATPAHGVARAARALLLLLFLLALFAPASPARQLTIEKFGVVIIVLPDGSIDVTETIAARFTGRWNGIYRAIPVEYESPQKLNYSLFLDVRDITDDAGAPLRYESRRERHYRKLKIFIPGAENAARTIVIRYRVENALRFFEDHDELYWNVTGDEWDVPIESAAARVVLPGPTTGIRAAAFTGGYGSREKAADAEILGAGVEVRTRRVLGFHEGLTAAVAWDKGFVHPPSLAKTISLFLRSNWPLFFPLLAFAAMFWLWYARGRDPRLRPIAPQYAPPDGLTPGEVGTLVDSSADMRDITATLVDLAVRGYLLIEEKKKEHMMGLWSDKDYVFHLRKKPPEWTQLAPHEMDLLNGMFSDGGVESVELSELHNSFYQNLPGIRDSIFDSLVAHRYYAQRPDSVQHRYVGLGIVVGVLGVWFGVAVAAKMGMAPLTFVLAGALTAAVICGFGWFMPARTIEGTRALESVLGFEDFLSHVEADRFERTIKTPEMFEKFLPFAMALGVEKKWVGAFQGICTQPPEWYRGGYGPTFFPLGFVNNLNVMSTQVGSVMTSAPRSSGGSAFGGDGGGGFSGGGFGGGGGGGF